jgi:hypothetical protein
MQKTLVWLVGAGIVVVGVLTRPDRDASSARATTYAYTNGLYWVGASTTPSGSSTHRVFDHLRQRQRAPVRPCRFDSRRIEPRADCGDRSLTPGAIKVCVW